MAYSKYVTQFKDKDDNVYGVMDEECRLSKADIITVNDTTPEPVKTFADGADGMPMGLTVGIEPVQDLHGQEAPYPAGGGKNIGYLSATNIYSEQQNTNTYVNNGVVVTGVGAYARCGFSIPVVTGETYTVSAKCKRGSVSVQRIGLSNETGWHYTYGILGTISETLSALSKTITATSDTLCVEVYPGSDSAVITIEDFQVEKNSSATSFAPYSNICPISGWTGAEVTRTGKNLLNIHGEYIIRSAVPTTVEIQENSVSVESTYSGAAYCGFIVPVKIGLTYVFSYTNNNSAQKARIAQLDEPITAIVSEYGDEMASGASVVAGKPYFLINFVDSSGTAEPTIYTNPMLEIGSTATAYEEFHGNTYDITFPQEAGTVYGGTLTENADGTGTLVVDRVGMTFDGTQSVGLTNWQMYSNSSAWLYSPSITPGIDNVSGAVANVISDTLKSIPYKAEDHGIYANYVGISLVGGTLWSVAMRVPVAGLDTKAKVNTWLAENNVKVVYKLASPITYTLSNLEVIETLKGMNNLWADTGDIKTVNYPADTKLYIDGKIAELQAMILENISNS